MDDVRVLAALPHPLLQEGIRVALSGTEFRVVAVASDQPSVAALAATVRPTVCRVDLDLPGGGIAAVRVLLRAHRGATVVMLADRYAQVDIVDALRAGASGFVDKDIDAASLPNVIRAALGGEAVVPRRLVGRLVQEVRSQAIAGPPGWSLVDLTRRELEVLRLMRDGLTTAGIAQRLFVSPGTVRSHVMSIMRKLHVSDRESLLRTGQVAAIDPGRPSASVR